MKNFGLLTALLVLSLAAFAWAATEPGINESDSPVTHATTDIGDIGTPTSRPSDWRLLRAPHE